MLRGTAFIVRQFVATASGSRFTRNRMCRIRWRSAPPCKGKTIAAEPMANEGGYEVDILEDGWTVTADGSLSAHFEHSVAITDGEPVILTLP